MGTPINRTACATRAELASILEVKVGLKHKVFSVGSPSATAFGSRAEPG